MSMAKFHPVLAVLLAANLNVQAASPATGMPVIGVVKAQGGFRLDHATVSGNATLFEGTTIETAAGASSQELRNGARVTLAPESRGRFYDDHAVLERGQGRLDRATTGYFIEAHGLTILPETGASTGRVTLEAGAGVQVAAVAGSLRVLNAQRMVLAKVPQGATLAFSPQSGAGATHLTGRLVYRDGHYLLTDETTNVTVEITGPGLKKLEGQRVEVSGRSDPTATPVSGATQVIRASTVSKLSGGTAAAGTGGAASGGASGATIAGTTIAIIGGVGAAAVVGGLAAAGTFSVSR